MITAPRGYAGLNPAVMIGAAAVGVAIFGTMVLTQSPRLVVLALVAVPALGIGATVLGNWRTGVYILLAWLLIEDLPRKFLGNDMRLYFAKDAIAVVVYVAFLAAWIRGREPRLRVGFLGPLLAFAGWGFVQVFNPASPSPIYGLLGLRLYLFYVPLLFLGYALLHDEGDLRRFLLFNLGLATVIGGLGIAQSIIGLDFLNPSDLAPELSELGKLVRQAPLSGELVPRPTSVFVSDGRFALYMLTAFLLSVGAVAYLVSRRARGAGIGSAGLGAIAVAILLSGARGPFLYSLASAGVLAGVFTYGAGPRLRWWVRRAVALGLVIGGAVLVMAVVLYPQAIGARWAFYYETLDPRSPATELAYRVWGYPLENFADVLASREWPLGNGIGTSSLGVQYVTGRLGVPSPQIGTENGYGTLILEIGIIGAVLWLLWTVGLVREGWRAARQLRGTPLFPLGFAIFWFMLLVLFPLTLTSIAAYQNYVINAYMWLLAGVLFRLPTMVRATGRSTYAR